MSEKPSNRIAKKEVLRVIQALPQNELSLEEIQDALEEAVLRAKVDQGLAELDRGDWVPHDQALEELRKWRR
ncbi:MAG: hypothetical protein AB7S38_34545 [Vulcanimicrobiota bacterium]